MAKAKSGRTGTLGTKSKAISPEFKAIVHNELGAGRSRVVREFLGLTLADEGWLLGVAAERLDKRMRDQFR